MNPFTRLYRRSRAFRVLCYFLMLLAILLVWIVSDDMWSNYTQVGDLTLFFSFLVFAAWAWWYVDMSLTRIWSGLGDMRNLLGVAHPWLRRCCGDTMARFLPQAETRRLRSELTHGGTRMTFAGINHFAVVPGKIMREQRGTARPKCDIGRLVPHQSGIA